MRKVWRAYRRWRLSSIACQMTDHKDCNGLRYPGSGGPACACPCHQ